MVDGSVTVAGLRRSIRPLRDLQTSPPKVRGSSHVRPRRAKARGSASPVVILTVGSLCCNCQRRACCLRSVQPHHEGHHLGAGNTAHKSAHKVPATMHTTAQTHTHTHRQTNGNHTNARACTHAKMRASHSIHPPLHTHTHTHTHSAFSEKANHFGNTF